MKTTGTPRPSTVAKYTEVLKALIIEIEETKGVFSAKEFYQKHLVSNSIMKASQLLNYISITSKRPGYMCTYKAHIKAEDVQPFHGRKIGEYILKIKYAVANKAKVQTKKEYEEPLANRKRQKEPEERKPLSVSEIKEFSYRLYKFPPTSEIIVELIYGVLPQLRDGALFQELVRRGYTGKLIKTNTLEA